MPNEQPQPKEYPAPYEHGCCPFVSLHVAGPAGSYLKKLMPCDPASCQLGLEDPGCCALINTAATLNALYMLHADEHVGQAQLRQLLKELSDRLGANLQSIHSNTSRLIDLAKSFDELPLIEAFVSIEHMLTHIHHDLERAFPPTQSQADYDEERRRQP